MSGWTRWATLCSTAAATTATATTRTRCARGAEARGAGGARARVRWARSHRRAAHAVWRPVCPAADRPRRRPPSLEVAAGAGAGSGTVESGHRVAEDDESDGDDESAGRRTRSLLRAARARGARGLDDYPAEMIYRSGDDRDGCATIVLVGERLHAAATAHGPGAAAATAVRRRPRRSARPRRRVKRLCSTSSTRRARSLGGRLGSSSSRHLPPTPGRRSTFCGCLMALPLAIHRSSRPSTCPSNAQDARHLHHPWRRTVGQAQVCRRAHAPPRVVRAGRAGRARACVEEDQRRRAQARRADGRRLLDRRAARPPRREPAAAPPVSAAAAPAAMGAP